MRLVTSCPECDAAFYISPDQLAAQRGDVRCGKCEHVFNALDRLAEVTDETSATAAAQSETPAPVAEHASTEPEEISTSIDIQILAEDHIDFIVDASAVNDTDLKTGSMEEGDSPEPAIAALNIPDFTAHPADETPSPTMMEDAIRYKAGKSRSEASEKNGLPKFLIFPLILILLALILAQTIYYLRSDIAARWPEARPTLEQACELIQCNIELPKNADLIAVDDSDLQEDANRQGLIHLSSTLVNRANHSQAYPLLELTLTDANDKPLLRRTFKPEEYLPAEASIRRGMLAEEEISIKLSLSVSDEAIAGYRLFVTY